MELYQIRSFVAVAEAGNFTRAAERLHISQPALSAQIKALENALELELFERRPNGVTPTAAGARLLVCARKVLDAARAFRDEARSIKGDIAGVVTVGTVSDPQFIRIAAFMAAAIERYPRIEIRFHHEVSGEAFEKVRDGLLDASFYYGDLEHQAVTGLPLREITYRIVAPSAWRERLAHATLAEVAVEPWVMTPPISTHHQIASGLFKRISISPAKVVEADDEFVVSSLVESGLGMGLMREDLAETAARRGAVCLWGDIKLTTTLKFIYQRTRRHDPVIDALVDILRNVWGTTEDAEHS
ncbi:MAG: LysR family transcriptional regulator [Betaproteobacteria bacterium]|nr:LysR family transcriptional regulator [Betaproteobacteria bacterium]